MNIYKQEILDGLSETIKAQASIAYCAPAILVNNIDQDSSWDVSRQTIQKIRASSNPNQIDLYYLKSILVSTGWNKNDDVFDPKETWAARSTPEDKQFNFMHNENDIIGHITGSYVVDRQGQKILAEDSEEVPLEFDIVTEAVLYNSWTNPDNRERMQKIISEIEDGKWFVSMECLFANFDYSVLDNNGNARIITRSEESAFLTKHLRAYGGTGEYEGYKIGRSLRDISFSGKGLVSKPANPRSVILDSSKAFSAKKEEYSISNVSKGDINMSDTNLEKQLADLQGELASSQEQVKTAKAEVESVTQEFTDKVSTLESSLAERETAIKAFEEKVASLEEAIAAKDKELSELSAAMKDMQKKEKDRMRKEKLVMAGFEDAEAEESVSLYDALSDEAFEAVVAGMKKKWGAMKDKMMKEKEKEMASETTVASEQETTETATEATSELFEGVESTEATLVDASDVNDELEATRASVAEWLTENVLRK
jgi:uncharacterized coiled-coil protein SlyX